MKIGMRTPSPTKTVKARTTGRFKRIAKRSYNPVYGKKGVGYLRDPERAVKNKIYHKLTYDPLEDVKNDTERFHPIPSKGLTFSIVFFYILGVLFAASAITTFLLNKSLNIVLIILAVICFVLYVILYKGKHG